MAAGKALIIDDDENILNLVGIILASMECEMLNPREKDVLKHDIFTHDCNLDDAPCKSKKISYVYTDFNYQIPGLNGLIVLKQIRAVPCIDQNIHLVLATAGFPVNVSETEVYRDLCDYNITLLKKPFNVAKLLSALKII